jgi:hypothetical protein
MDREMQQRVFVIQRGSRIKLFSIYIVRKGCQMVAFFACNAQKTQSLQN